MRQHVDGGQIFGQPERILVTHLDHRRAESDTRGALARRRQKRRGGRHRALQMSLTYPRAVVAERLADAKLVERALETGERRIVGIITRRQESKMIDANRAHSGPRCCSETASMPCLKRPVPVERYRATHAPVHASG
ncbi:hypothetical protein GGD40_000412 [Paraburkholderia bryophila]|uniref:Uncharacterized protein n=1 Tax=Paraburkholderia bryophila TaxID=420952 RepID=A0A7Y9WJJ2_9BURK|nr:hypothetical protein [Paraburkholderia bryophila]